MNIRKPLVKTVISLSIILLALIVTEAGVKFASRFRYVGFEDKQHSWVDIAETAEGANSACQSDLAQAIKDKDTAIFANNKDLK